MKNSMLQRVNDGNGKSGSLKGPAIIFYLISLVVAFIAGGYFERAKAPVVPNRVNVETVSEISTPPEQTPAPLAPATPAPTASFKPPVLITSEGPSSTPVRIEKAVAVAPVVASVPSIAAAPVVTPAKQPGAVTLTEAVTDIPVKQDGKITGYINLQAGQQIVPVSVENGQIKVKSGDNFVYVPVKSTNMATH
ncbi:MAG: hypothetical protein WCD79_02320 [Chthoniobacteraceae bacterium]